MRVVIDARPALDPRKTGVGHYAERIVRALPHADPSLEVVAWYLYAKGLFTRRRFFDDTGAPNLSERASRFPARIFGPLSTRLRVPRLEWSSDFDAALATNFLPPATRRRDRVVMVVHDLAFRRFPETAPHVDERWMRMFEGWLADCARIIVPSESTREDLVELYDVEPGRVDAIHHGTDPDAFATPPEDEVRSVRRRLGLTGPYLLFVGGIEPRKNLAALARAFSLVPPKATLVIAGGAVRWFPKAADDMRAAVEALPLEVRGRVLLPGYVSEADKVALMAGATALMYPSLYEGFGFPVLEGFAAGVPVLTSNLSSLPEVAGDAALLVDPTDEDAIARGITLLLDDEDLRSGLVERGRERLRLFTWERCALQTAETLRMAAGVDSGHP
jgi:glycosyltransferase involved in cell wall biosynthesis